MSNKEYDEKYELKSLIKAQEEKINELNQKLEIAKDAVESMIVYENKKPSFEFYKKRHTALEKYRSVFK
jgi:hypothetical protein